MSTAKFDTLSNLAGTRTIPVDTVAQGTARAWVNFNGTGTVAIRASFNVSSITDNGTGDYTLNFTTALPDANYATVFGTGGTGSSFVVRIPDTPAQTTTSQRIWALSTASALQDQAFISVSIFR